MANGTPLYGLQEGGTGDTRALGLTFYNATKMAFESQSLLWNTQQKQTITQGKSFQFPFIGSGDYEEHTPGAFLTGVTDPIVEERTVPVDNKAIIASNWVPYTDEAVRHYQFIGPVAMRQGSALAHALDSRAGRMIAKGARQLATQSGEFKSGVLVRRNAASVEAAYPVTAKGSRDLQADMAEVYQGFQERDALMPGDEAMAFISPYLMRVLLQDNSLQSQDYLLNPATNNRVNAIVGKVSGFRVIVHNILPQYTLATGKPGFAAGGTSGVVTAGESAYQGRFDHTAALFTAASDALGIVQFGDISTEGPNWKDDRDSWFLKAKWFGGVKWIRKECCGELYCATAAYTDGDSDNEYDG